MPAGGSPLSRPHPGPSAVASPVTWHCGWYSWKLYAAHLLRIVHMSQNLPACVGVCPAHVGEIEEIVCSLNQIMCVNNLLALITAVGRHGVRGLCLGFRRQPRGGAGVRGGRQWAVPTHRGTARPSLTPILCRARLGTCPDERPPPGRARPLSEAQPAPSRPSPK